MLLAYFNCFCIFASGSKYSSVLINIFLKFLTICKLFVKNSSHIFTIKTWLTVFVSGLILSSSASTDNNLDNQILPPTPGKLFFVKFDAKFS